jgi:hypothetical protein
MESLKVKAKSGESGFDELMRLSRQTARQAESLSVAEKQRQEQQEKAQGIRQGLKEISVSVALQQLKLVAKDEVIEKVSALTKKQGINELRKLISDSVHDLEKQTGNVASSKTDLATIERSVKTLAILIELYFALSD